MVSRSASSYAPSIVLALLLSGAVHPVPGVDGTPSSVRVSLSAANGGVGSWSRAFNCMPQNHEFRTTPTFNKASASLVYLRLKTGTSETCKPGPAASDGTAPPHVVGSRFEFEPADLAAVNGTVALVNGSSCPFSTIPDSSSGTSPWWYYLGDFQARVDAALKAGATGVLWGEGVAGKIPENMFSRFVQAAPVCTFESAEFDALLAATGLAAASPGATGVADTEATYMYRVADDLVPNPPVTYLTVEEPWKAGGPDGLQYPIPAFTATFNPKTHPGVEAPVVAADFLAACKTADYVACASCWARAAAGQSPFAADLVGKIAFFSITDAAHVGCYPSYNMWAIAAERAGAVAIVHGSLADVSSWAVPGPYLVPSDVASPFFSLLRIHTDTLLAAMAESASHPEHALLLRTPALVGGAGPSYFATRSKQYGPAPVLFWKSLDEHFICDAGQAHFSPRPWAGLPLTTTTSGDASSSISALDANRVVVLDPSPECRDGSSGASACGACLLQQPSQQVSRAWSRKGNATIELPLPLTGNGGPVATTLAMNSKFGDDVVAAVLLEDFQCFPSFEQFVDVAVAAGAKAVLLVFPPGQSVQTMYGSVEVGDGESPDALEPIPAFSVSFSCFTRAFAAAESVHVDIPAIDGEGEVVLGAIAAAAGYAMAPTDSLEDTVLTVIEGPDSLCGPANKCFAGQARWNPVKYPAVQARMLGVQTIAACRSLATCLACDVAASRSENGDLGKYVDLDGNPLTLDAMKGMIIFMAEEQLACLKPYTNALRDAQYAGALGVVIGNAGNATVTMVQTAVPFEVKIPVFNLAAGVGVAFGQALVNKKTVSVRLPRIEAGVALTDGVFAVDDGSLVYGSGYSHLNPVAPAPPSTVGEMLNTNDKIAVAFGVVGFSVGVVAVGFGIHRWRRIRRMFARNQGHLSTQTTGGGGDDLEFTDVTSGGLLGDGTETSDGGVIIGRATRWNSSARKTPAAAAADIEMGGSAGRAAKAVPGKGLALFANSAAGGGGGGGSRPDAMTLRGDHRVSELRRQKSSGGQSVSSSHSFGSTDGLLPRDSSAGG